MTDTSPAPELHLAVPADLAVLLPLVRAYHEFEGMQLSDAHRSRVLSRLLSDASLGAVWLVRIGTDTVGYIALCFGYSIELGGRDAYVDEFYLLDAWRGRGLGTQVLRRLQAEARRLEVAVLYLEVDRDNQRARRLYASAGFASRESFMLMTCQLGAGV